MTQEIKPCPFCGSTDIDPEGVACFKPEYKGGSVGWDKATDDMIVHRPACNSCGATTDGDWNTRAEPAPLPDEVEREICSMRKTIAVAGKHPDFVVRIDILKSILDARDNSNFLEKAMWSALAFLIADDFKAAKNTLDDALVKINLSHKGE